MLNATINEVELRAFAEIVVRATLAAIEESRFASQERLGFTESQAAELLGLPKHVLRDCRDRGEISGRLIGKRMVYSRKELEKFVAACGGKK